MATRRWLAALLVVATTATRPAVGAEKIYNIGGDVSAPRLINRVEPKVSEKCLKGHVLYSTFSMYKFVISETGNVVSVTALKLPKIKPPCPEFDETYRKAFSQWHYEPAKLNGKAVAVYCTVTVNYCP